jgi:hypothetical protein
MGRRCGPSGDVPIREGHRATFCMLSQHVPHGFSKFQEKRKSAVNPNRVVNSDTVQGQRVASSHRLVSLCP